MEHLKGTSFVNPKSKITYFVLTIMPVPESAEEQEELRELLHDSIQSRGANQDKLAEFESRLRDDKFTVTLWALGSIRLTDSINLLSISLCPFVDEEGHMKYGFQAYPGKWLY